MFPPIPAARAFYTHQHGHAGSKEVPSTPTESLSYATHLRAELRGALVTSVPDGFFIMLIVTRKPPAALWQRAQACVVTRTGHELCH